MKEYKYLYQKMLEDDVIRKAYKKLRKGKTKRKEIIFIDANLDEEVAKMKEMIRNTKPEGVEVEHPELAYRPCKRTPKYIREHGKTRKIYMPEIHEQWLHHIIVLILEPIIMRTAYPYSCGSFPKRGAHYGKRRMEIWIKQGKDIRNFAKMDIRHFYDNIKIDILIKEVRTRIKDDWFIHMIWVCLNQFTKGIPLGFYISQWLANYLLEPLDKYIVEKLGFDKFIRYMDDMVIMSNSKKKLRQAIIEIKKFLGRRFRLKLKQNYQVCKFHFEKTKGEAVKIIGRCIDFMGFKFLRNRVQMRKSIMIAATRLVGRMERSKASNRGYYKKHIQAMLSYMGWFDCTHTYNCFVDRIKPLIRIRNLKKIISKIQRRLNNEGMDKGTMRDQTRYTAAYIC